MAGRKFDVVFVDLEKGFDRVLTEVIWGGNEKETYN